MNCGGIPEGLLESELFGHMKGAFTGATESRAGFFQTADGGTIFLDEVSETSPAMQVKLLRVLQDREVLMVGATRPRSVDARVLAATNKDLGALTGKGQFREDLFFRLNVIGIAAPPLRERGDDVLLLSRRFLEKYAVEYGVEAPRLSDRVLEVLTDYPWPGNVRELKNLVDRHHILYPGEQIDFADLPLDITQAAKSTSHGKNHAESLEKAKIKDTLIACNWNQSKAARTLKMSLGALRRRIKKYNISRNN